jgi:hypothetical protein
MPGCTAAVLRWYAIGVGTQGIAFALGSRMPALGGLALTPLGAFVSMLADILSNVSGHAGSTRSSGQYMDLDPLGWAVFDLIKRRARRTGPSNDRARLQYSVPPPPPIARDVVHRPRASATRVR